MVQALGRSLACPACAKLEVRTATTQTGQHLNRSVFASRLSPTCHRTTRPNLLRTTQDTASFVSQTAISGFTKHAENDCRQRMCGYYMKTYARYSKISIFSSPSSPQRSLSRSSMSYPLSYPWSSITLFHSRLLSVGGNNIVMGCFIPWVRVILDRHWRWVLRGNRGSLCPTGCSGCSFSGPLSPL